MGGNKSTPRFAFPATSSAPKSTEIITRMEQKVLLSQEFLYKQHTYLTNQVQRNSTLRSLKTSTDIYRMFLDTRKSAIDTKDKPTELIQPKAPISSVPGKKTKPKHITRRKSDKRKPAPSMKNKHKESKSVIRPSKVRREMNNEEINLNIKEDKPKVVPYAKQYDNPFMRLGQVNTHIRQELPQFDRVSLLPVEVFRVILEYSIDSFRSIMFVNPAWYHAVNSALELWLNPIENSFIKMYSNYLLFKDSYTSSRVMHFCGKKTVKIERILKYESLNSISGKTITIAFKYKYYNELNNEYICKYTFDSVKKGNILVWLHKAENELKASVQPIVTVCQGDNIELVFPLYSLRGLIDVNSVVWISPLFQNIPKENALNYKREHRMVRVKDRSEKLIADLGRISDLEDSQIIWRVINDVPGTLKQLKLNLVKKYFHIVKAEYSDIDIYAAKFILKAKCSGKIPFELFGITIIIKEEWEECTWEVKRVGLLFERHTDLELRVGDVLVVYVSKPLLK